VRLRRERAVGDDAVIIIAPHRANNVSRAVVCRAARRGVTTTTNDDARGVGCLEFSNEARQNQAP
jgi:predicted ThiF/HesA family dinucleotide-utilizing enzyme